MYVARHAGKQKYYKEEISPEFLHLLFEQDDSIHITSMILLILSFEKNNVNI